MTYAQARRLAKLRQDVEDAEEALAWSVQHQGRTPFTSDHAERNADVTAARLRLQEALDDELDMPLASALKQAVVGQPERTR